MGNFVNPCKKWVPTKVVDIKHSANSTFKSITCMCLFYYWDQWEPDPNIKSYFKGFVKPA